MLSPRFKQKIVTCVFILIIVIAILVTLRSMFPKNTEEEPVSSDTSSSVSVPAIESSSTGEDTSSSVDSNLNLTISGDSPDVAAAEDILVPESE